MNTCLPAETAASKCSRAEVWRCGKDDYINTGVNYLLIGIEARKALLFSYLHAVLGQALPAGGNPVGKDITQGCYCKVGTRVKKIQRSAGAPASAAYKASFEQRTVRC